MTMCVLAFVKIDVFLLLTLISPVFLVLLIMAVRELQILQRQIGIVVTVCVYMFCLLGLLWFAFDTRLFQLNDPSVINFLMMLISYAVFPLALIVIAIIGAVAALVQHKESMVVNNQL